MEGDGETWASFFCVMKLHKEPDYFVNLPQKQKAVILAFIDERIKQDKEAEDELEQKAKG